MGSATLTSGRTCTPTLSCPEAPPCTLVLLTACRRRSPPLPPPPSRSRSSLPLHLPADVDLQAGVRRVRPLHRPQEVLLSASSSSSRGFILLTYPLLHIPTNIDVIMQIYCTLSHTN